MSEMTLTICAEAEKNVPLSCDEVRVRKSRLSPTNNELAAHSFPGRKSQESQTFEEIAAGFLSMPDVETDTEPCTPAELAIDDPGDKKESEYDVLEEERRRATYRGRTVWMLRRYMRYSMETGRLPSLLGREFFRAKVTRFTSITFEDRVIFVHDMESCLNRLDDFSRKVIGRVVLQEYSHEEAAHLLGCARMTLHRTLLDALDTLGSILLRVGLLERLEFRPRKILSRG